jgi:o-succinylbenzoate synthase
MRKASFKKHQLIFKRPGGTSRGVLHTKETFFLSIQLGERTGYGECAVFHGLSIDDRPDYESRLQWVCDHINEDPNYLLHELQEFPSIQFGLEQGLKSLESADPFVLFPSSFTNGKDRIPINGLVWMGTKDFMKQQIVDLLQAGFSTIKMKIGAIDFDTELDILKTLRRSFDKQDLEIRVDANGAFAPDSALKKMDSLAALDVHSIEQPIRAGQWDDMARICRESPLPVALDEELIGIFDVTKKEELLHIINPQFIILKPSLVGGFKGSEEWIHSAEKKGIGWWVTSALESNLGLNAIAQWTYALESNRVQGLGTGSLFTNNLECPLQVKSGYLTYDDKGSWENAFNELETLDNA